MADSLERRDDIAQRALCQRAEAKVPLRRSVLARMAGEKARRPQFVRIAKLQARFTTQALASAVIVGSRPGRGRSSSAAIGP